MSPFRPLPTIRSVRPARGVLVAAVVLPLLAGFARTAHALQPLKEFLESAKTYNPDNRAAHAAVQQRDAEVSVSTGVLEPNLQGNVMYTHNQYEVDTSSLIQLSPQVIALMGGPVCRTP